MEAVRYSKTEREKNLHSTFYLCKNIQNHSENDNKAKQKAKKEKKIITSFCRGHVHPAGTSVISS